MRTIKSIVKEDRKDISIYTATLSDESTVAIEADTKAEAEQKFEAWLEEQESRQS